MIYSALLLYVCLWPQDRALEPAFSYVGVPSFKNLGQVFSVKAGEILPMPSPSALPQVIEKHEGSMTFRITTEDARQILQRDDVEASPGATLSVEGMIRQELDIKAARQEIGRWPLLSVPPDEQWYFISSVLSARRLVLSQVTVESRQDVTDRGWAAKGESLEFLSESSIPFAVSFRRLEPVRGVTGPIDLKVGEAERVSTPISRFFELGAPKSSDHLQIPDTLSFGPQKTWVNAFNRLKTRIKRSYQSFSVYTFKGDGFVMLLPQENLLPNSTQPDRPRFSAYPNFPNPLHFWKDNVANRRLIMFIVTTKGLDHQEEVIPTPTEFTIRGESNALPSSLSGDSTEHRDAKVYALVIHWRYTGPSSPSLLVPPATMNAKDHLNAAGLFTMGELNGD